MAAPIVDLGDAETQLSQLVQRAVRGEEIVIGRRGEPLVRLVPVAERRKPREPREPGLLKGKVRISKNFDDPLPEDLLAAFEGRE